MCGWRNVNCANGVYLVLFVFVFQFVSVFVDQLFGDGIWVNFFGTLAVDHVDGNSGSNLIMVEG